MKPDKRQMMQTAGKSLEAEDKIFAGGLKQGVERKTSKRSA